MAGLPITAMVAATQVLNADVIPIVHAGANLKVTRPVYLAAVPAEPISLTGNGTNVTIDNTGNVEILMASTKAIKIWNGSAHEFVTFGPGGDCLFEVSASKNFIVKTANGNQFNIDNLGNVVLIGAPGGAIQLAVGANSITMVDGASIQLAVDPGQVCFVPYLDGTAGAWKVAPPADMNTAIDRIADFIHNNFGVIP